MNQKFVIATLPEEILCHIFLQCDLRTLWHVRLVCKRWFAIASDRRIYTFVKRRDHSFKTCLFLLKKNYKEVFHFLKFHKSILRFVKFIHQHPFEMLSLLGIEVVNDIDRMNDASLKALTCLLWHFGTITDSIQHLLYQDTIFSQWSTPEMAFRGPSLVNRLVSHLQRFVGEEFVQKIIKPCTQNLIHMMKEEDIQTKSKCAELFLHRILDTIDKLPKEFYVIYQTFRTIAREKKQDEFVKPGILTVFIYRFINGSLISSANSITHYLHRAVLIAHTIQEACNGVIQNSGSLSTKNESSSMNIHSVKSSELIEKIFEKLMSGCEHLNVPNRVEIYSRPKPTVLIDSVKELVKVAQSNFSNILLRATKNFPSIAKKLGSILQHPEFLSFSVKDLDKSHK